jgi:hypothetical protein
MGYPQVPPQSNTGCIVVGVVALVLVILIGGAVFLHQTDPAAGRDEDAAKQSMLLPRDVGPNFVELERDSAARARGGLRVSSDFDDCSSSTPVLEQDGQAAADVLYLGQSTVAVQVLGSEVIAMGSKESATTLYDALDASARDCLLGVLRGAARQFAFTAELESVDPPKLGDRATALHGTVSTSSAGPVFATVDVVFVLKGRAVIVFIALDSSTSLSAARVASLVGDVVGRLPERLT